MSHRTLTRDGATSAVPVLMYHGVGRVLRDWAWSDLTVPASVFAGHLRALAGAGYHTVSLDDLYAHITGARLLDDRALVLTFDDGYLDNWTYAAPLMARYGFSGTVLVTPEFVDPSDEVRPTLEDADAGRVRREEIPVRGFLSWAELRKASADGILDVQCHGMTHTWYPTSDRVVDFHHPGDDYYWLDWNAHPESKPFYLVDPGDSRVPYGTPVYEHSKSLACTRYFPDDRESEVLAEHVRSHGGDGFFSRRGWREDLHAVLARWRGENEPRGRTEAPEERRRRLDVELVASKERIEAELGRRVDYLVWPGGAYDAESLAAARRVYKAVTLRSRERGSFANRPGENPDRIVRCGAPEMQYDGRTFFMGGRYLLHFIEEFKGAKIARRRRQVLKLGYLTASRLRLWTARDE